MKRYAAKLLFQFRVRVEGDNGKKRTCEERIILLPARSAQDALRSAKRSGRASEHSYQNSGGNTVFFEFIGVMELLCLEPECEQAEVWYEIKERLLPMERKALLIPAETDLNAIRNETAPPSTGVTRQ